MQYRKTGNIGLNLSALGFGMMRLPLSGNQQVDAAASAGLLRSAIDSGLNYVDTAYNYMDGESESVTARALKNGYREKVFLATKSPLWLIEKAEDFERILDEQLSRLHTEQIDFYMLHGVGAYTWRHTVLPLRLLDRLEAAKRAGKIRYTGFSFHDNFDLFREIVDCGLQWDFCQIQLNYLDTRFQAGMKGLRYASEKGLAVVVMEPLRGGYLADVPPRVRELFAKTNKSPVEWALDFLWNMPEISVVLSGMNTLEQVRENISFAGRSAPGMLGESGCAVIRQAQELFAGYDIIPCTGCTYCKPECPLDVAIPYNFLTYNRYRISGNLEKEKHQYHDWVQYFGEKASACVACRACEAICPQHLVISEQLKIVANTFE